MDKILVFDLWGDYAHFKKHYTTTSPLSFPFPPRTTISGIISAIIGLDKEEYLTYFGRDSAWISIRLLSPIKKIRLGQLLIDTDTRSSFFNIKRTRIRIEYIKDPKYRIYFYHSNQEKIHRLLKEHLMEHQSVYTVSLGLSQLLANFKFVGEYPLHKVLRQSLVEIDSVVSSEDVSKIEFEEGKEYFSTNIPIEMQKGRVVTKYSEVSYERNGQKILCRPNSYYEVGNGERILFL